MVLPITDSSSSSSTADVSTDIPEPLILIADDVAANVELLTDQLAALGFRTISATDGPSAIALAYEVRPDLCILDIAMPAGTLGVADRTTGFEVCRRIKRDPRTARTPVIFVTALNDTADRVKAIEAGGDDFLTKPHNRLVLGARVRSLLKLKAATDALEDSYRKLRELEKVRDDLMKMIVHDLKTPLTTVLGTLEMVVDGDFGEVNENQRTALQDAETKAQELLTLIGDLLEIARLEEPEVHLERTEITPADFVQEVLDEWNVRFQQDAASINVLIESTLSPVYADRQLLKRTFSNLIQNALVHSAGPVTLTISARVVSLPGESAGQAMLFSLADNGPGIAPEFHEIIFQKFRGAKSPNVPRVRSSGLGLAFCRLVAEAHGGRIWVHSTPGEGSTFFVQLPLRRSPRT